MIVHGLNINGLNSTSKIYFQHESHDSFERGEYDSGKIRSICQKFNNSKIRFHFKILKISHGVFSAVPKPFYSPKMIYIISYESYNSYDMNFGPSETRFETRWF